MTQLCSSRFTLHKCLLPVVFLRLQLYHTSDTNEESTAAAEWVESRWQDDAYLPVLSKFLASSPRLFAFLAAPEDAHFSMSLDVPKSFHQAS